MPQPLQYQGPVVLQRRRAPAWVWSIVGVYLVLLAGVLLLPIWAALADTSGFEGPVLVAVLVALPLMCGMALLRTPVRNLGGRPTTRQSYVLPLTAAAILFGLLLGAVGLTVAEVAFGSEDSEPLLAAAISATGGWLVWTAVFWFASRSRDPARLAGRFHRWLLAGSVAELLVAVPSHVYVRHRGDCCAGVWTGTAICLGSLVMLVCFGPSVLLLYLKRSRQIRPGA